MHHVLRLSLTLLLLTITSATRAAAPDYHQTMLTRIFPAGAGQGETVKVELACRNGGSAGATGVVIDGPPGITVKEFKSTKSGTVEAVFQIAADAQPGRRMVRLQGGRTGLTNFRWFFVSPLKEFVEKEPNHTPPTAQEVTIPTVVNGVVRQALDLDYFRFQAKAGQEIVAAVHAHRLDTMGFARGTYGFFDSDLQLLDEVGNVLAEAGDTVGYDPVIHYTIKQDGWYMARVSGMGFKGYPDAVYRLTLGEVPYPMSIFPPGGRRGEVIEVELSGPNVPPGTTVKVSVPSDDPFPMQYVGIEGEFAGLSELAFVRGKHPEILAVQQHDTRETALAGSIPLTVNARFDVDSSEHWYRLPLAKGQRVTLDVLAQRHLQGQIDSLLTVYDPQGKVAAQNDDSPLYGGECTHDFVPFDSRLDLTAKAAGDYLVCVSEQTGTRGPRAAYRLTVEPTAPDFALHLFPDAVPVWGPGSSAAFAVEVIRTGGLKADIDLRIEGLPEGWTGSRNISHFHAYRDPKGAFGAKTFLTITAPADAPVGEMAEFQVVGSAQLKDRTIEHIAQPLTLYVWQEPNHFRYSPIARAAVAPSVGITLASSVKQVEGKAGQTIQVPITIDRKTGHEKDPLTVSINEARTHHQCAVGPPVTVKGPVKKFDVPLTIPANKKPGTYGIVVAMGWSSETRKGMPGPCTELIYLKVLE